MKIILDQEPITDIIKTEQMQLTVKFIPEGGDEEIRLKSIVNLIKDGAKIEQKYINP
jgi:hypothetical protein